MAASRLARCFGGIMRKQHGCRHVSPAVARSMSMMASSSCWQWQRCLHTTSKPSNNDSRSSSSASSASVVASLASVAAGLTVFSNAVSCDDHPKPFVVVLTGGPCGGKSTAMAALSARLTALGFAVYVVPEVATMMITGGVSFQDVNDEQLHEIESAFMDMQATLEDKFTRIAKSKKKPTVILCDRGMMDLSAYIPKWMWEVMLEEKHLDVFDMRDKRYDAVVHMVTAADGAEKFYTTANNSARTETAAQARALDQTLRAAYIGHPRLAIVDNSTDFKSKVRRVSDFICHCVGAPGPAETERRFVLPIASIDSTTSAWPADVPYEDFDVEVTFLQTADNSQARLQRRCQGHSTTYYASVQVNKGKDSSVVERTVSGREYMTLGNQALPDVPVQRRRERCFAYEKRYYVLREQDVPGKGHLVMLKVDDDTHVPAAAVLPDFLVGSSHVAEVTHDKEYTTAGLAGIQ